MLLDYAVELGVSLEPGMPAPEMARRIRQRQELLLEMDREALLDIVVWARRPVRKSASKEHLAREIAQVACTDYDRLSARGLAALARLRGLAPAERPERIAQQLLKQDGVWKRFAVRRRALLGSLISRVLEGSSPEDAQEYRFLPEEAGGVEAARPSLRDHVEQHGVVGGIAHRIRGAADDYIRVKLDEIERRIDAKLEQIDDRLAEWRDREIANRLKILRMTLAFTVLVAVLSLGYNYFKHRMAPNDGGASSRAVLPANE